MIAGTPRLLHLAIGLVEWVRKSGEDMPTALVDLSNEAQDLLKAIDGEK